MRPTIIITLALILAALGSGCASTGPWHDGKSTVATKEWPAIAKGPGGGSAKNADPFRRVWRGKATWGLLKWDQDKSSAPKGAPSEVLQAIRDEVGRTNRAAPKAPDAYLAVTIYRYEPAGFFSDPHLEYEAVARDEKGALLWVVDGEIEPTDDLAESPADTEASIIGREVARNLRAGVRR